MNLPSVIKAENLLQEAEKLNQGLWVAHCKTTGFCAKAIAEKCNNLNPDTAYIFGLLTI